MGDERSLHGVGRNDIGGLFIPATNAVQPESCRERYYQHDAW